MSIELLTLILFASVFLLFSTGLPIAFALGAVGAGFAIIIWGADHLPILASAAYSSVVSLNLIAIPLFVFMGWVFERSGIADDLFQAVYVWLGNVPGGLAIGTLLISTIFAAMCGGVDAAIFMLAAVALPPMLKRGYDKRMAIGTVVVGALLGIIIPPSIMVIVYCVQTGESVGRLYLGCMLPGLMLAGLYMLYIGIRCRLNPRLGPPAPPETRMGWGVRIASLKSVILPLLLVLFIIGGIYGGIVSPLEASAVGATGAIVIAAVYRRLTWAMLKEVIYKTVFVCGFLGWLLIGVSIFVSVYQGIGAPELAIKIAQALPGSGLLTLITTQITILLSGMVMDDFAVVMIFGPVFAPAIEALGYSTLWYGVLFMVNMQLAMLTPPYGYAVILTSAAVSKEYAIPIVEIYRAVLPFIGIQLFVLILIMIFPQIATFLPNLLIGGG